MKNPRLQVSRKLLYGIAGSLLLATSVFLAGAAAYLVRAEVAPALREGSLSITTDSMILNILWEGNEIYILLAAYLLLSAGLAGGAIRLFRNGLRTGR